jgi:hypothetical protein
MLVWDDKARSMGELNSPVRTRGDELGDRSDQVKISEYRPDDLAACRALWVELTRSS